MLQIIYQTVVKEAASGAHDLVCSVLACPGVLIQLVHEQSDLVKLRGQSIPDASCDATRWVRSCFASFTSSLLKRKVITVLYLMQLGLMCDGGSSHRNMLWHVPQHISKMDGQCFTRHSQPDHQLQSMLCTRAETASVCGTTIDKGRRFKANCRHSTITDQQSRWWLLLRTQDLEDECVFVPADAAHQV